MAHKVRRQMFFKLLSLLPQINFIFFIIVSPLCFLMLSSLFCSDYLYISVHTIIWNNYCLCKNTVHLNIEDRRNLRWKNYIKIATSSFLLVYILGWKIDNNNSNKTVHFCFITNPHNKGYTNKITSLNRVPPASDD